MAQLTFPITHDGLLVDAVVNLEAPTLLALRGQGVSRSPLLGRGLVDTGSNVAGVSAAYLQQLGVPPETQSSTTGIGGLVSVNLHRVSLHLRDGNDPGSAWLSHPSLLVMDLAPGLPFDVLFGLDFLAYCKLIVDGPAGRFTLEF